MGGEDKAFLCFEGQLLILRTISVLKSLFPEIFIVTNSPRSYERYAKDAAIIEDNIKEKGPLGGISAALAQTKREAVFFVACDMPLLHNGIIARQIREFKKMDVDVLVPRIGDRLEPLHGIYRQRISEKLLLFLQKSQRHSVREFLKKVETGYWELADTAANRKYFTNVNTPEELQKVTGAQEHRGTGAQGHRSTGAQEHRCTGSIRNTGAQEHKGTGTKGHRHKGAQGHREYKKHRSTGAQGHKGTGTKGHRHRV